MAVDPNIKKKADDIRNKVYGKEVRESLASGLEEMSSDVVENEGRQSVVEGRQDSVESQWQVVSDEMTDKDVISAPEIIAARNGESNLKDRIDKDYQEVTAQLAQIDYKEINPHEYEDYLENDDWTTVIHKIFEDNERGVIKFPIGTFKFKTPIGRIKNGFIITGVNRYQTTFNIDLTGDYFVRAGLETGFTNIGVRIDYRSDYPKNIFEYNSNALGVTHPGRTWVFDVNNIYFDNTYDNVAEDRLPNLFGVYAQNFDDKGVVNNFCSYVMYFNPHNIKFEGVNKFVDFKLTQKDGGNQVWATEVNFEKVTGMRLKKGLEIRIDNQSSFNLDQVSRLYLTDVSFQGNHDGSFGNENWTQTEFLNVYGDERRSVRINLQGATKFWDTDLSGYLDYGDVQIHGEFLYSDWDSGVTENRKLGFVLGRNSTVDWVGRNPTHKIIETGISNRNIRVEPHETENGGVGELFQNTPEYYNYNTGFVTDFKSFHPVDDPDRTSDNITEFYNRSHGQVKLTSIKWGERNDFEISVRSEPTLKHNYIGDNRDSKANTNDWFGANGAKFELGGYGGQYSIEPGDSVEHSATFRESFVGIPFVSVSLTEGYNGKHIVEDIIPTSEGFTVKIANIGDRKGGVSLQWFAVGIGYVKPLES